MSQIRFNWLGGIYIFSPKEEWIINDFIDFFDTGASHEDIVFEVKTKIFPILQIIKKELKEIKNDRIPPCMGD